MKKLLIVLSCATVFPAYAVVEHSAFFEPFNEPYEEYNVHAQFTRTVEPVCYVQQASYTDDGVRRGEQGEQYISDTDLYASGSMLVDVTTNLGKDVQFVKVPGEWSTKKASGLIDLIVNYDHESPIVTAAPNSNKVRFTIDNTLTVMSGQPNGSYNILGNEIETTYKSSEIVCGYNDYEQK